MPPEPTSPVDVLNAKPEAPAAAATDTSPLGRLTTITAEGIKDLQTAAQDLRDAKAQAQGYLADSARETQRILDLQQQRVGGVEGEFGRLKTQAGALPRPPEAPDEPDVPSRAPQPFLNLGENAGFVQSLNTTLYSLGLLAQMGMGIAKGYPSGALAAYSGALEGWAKGDAVRAENMWKEYLAGVGKMSREYQRQRQEYQDILDRFGLSKDMLATQLSLAAAQNGLDSTRIQLAAREPEQFMKMVDLFERPIQDITQRSVQMNAELAKMYIAKEMHDQTQAYREELLKIKKQDAVGGGPGGSSLSPDALEMSARAYLQTGQLPPMGMSRYGAQTRAAIINRATEIAKGSGMGLENQAQRQMLYKANQTEMNRIQAQRGPILSFARTADKNLDIALEMSDKVDRTGATVFNKWLQAGRTATGDVDTARFHAAVITAATEYARVMSGGSVTSDKAREEANSIISKMYTKGQFRGVVDIMRRDMQNRIKGYDEQLQSIRESMQAFGAEGRAAANLADDDMLDRELGLK